MSNLEKAARQAKPASLRPKQHDYASYVGYTRALEAYCDSLEQAEPVVLAHNDILRMAREAGWPASVVHPHGPGVDTSGYSALAALERFAALVRADVVASAKKAEPVIDDKPVPDAWHLSGYGMESRVMIGEPSERHRQLFSDIRPMYWHPAKQAEPVQAEPVAWMYEWQGSRHLTFTDQRFVEQAHPHFNKSTPLYTAPQQAERVSAPPKSFRVGYMTGYDDGQRELMEKQQAEPGACGHESCDCRGYCKRKQAEPVPPWYRQFCNCPKCSEAPKQAEPAVESVTEEVEPVVVQYIESDDNQGEAK